jgi:phosphoglycolate phosphatase-like HAD superfamily hydrolase
MSRKLNYEIISGGVLNLIGYLASNQIKPPKDPEHSRMEDEQNIPPCMIEDMSNEMIEIYLSQARQEQHEDEEYREWERVWHERYWADYYNACSDL